jgi:hypothetical protein
MTTFLTNDNGTTRPMTETEIAALEAIQIETAEQNRINNDRIAMRQAVLDKLGLTADEAQLLLG